MHPNENSMRRGQWWLLCVLIIPALLSCKMGGTTSRHRPLPSHETGVKGGPKAPAGRVSAIQRGMLKVHNSLRTSFGIPPLVWSEKLALIARKRAVNLADNNNCQMRHTRSGLGENLFWANALTWSDGRREVRKISAEYVAGAWAGEKRDYNYTSNSCRSDAMCGHYTQMVWGDSRELGCAMATCPDDGQIWVCVYSPPGNYIGQRPY